MIALHTADWHLHSSGGRFDPETNLNARLADLFKCAKFTIEDGIARGAQLALIAGDVFHGWKPTPTEVRCAKWAIEPAQRAGVPVLILKGNHDDVRTLTDQHALDLLRDMVGVTVIDRPCLLNVWNHEGEESYQSDYTIEPLDMALPDGADLEMQIACMPWPNKQFLLTEEENRKLSPGDLNLLMRGKVMDILRGLAAQRIEGVPCVLLGHFSVDVAIAGAGDRLMLLGGEWTMNLQDLEGLGFDAVLLGHIHKRQELSATTVYCGSPEAVSFGEESDEHAYYLWETNSLGVQVSESVFTPSRRLRTLSLNDFNEDGTVLSDVKESIVRFEIPPDSMLSVEEARRAIEAAGAVEARVTKGRAETKLRREVELTAGMDLPTAIRLWTGQKPDLAALTEDLVSVAGEVAEGGAL